MYKHHSLFDDSPVRQFWLLYAFPLYYFKYYISFHKESSLLHYRLALILKHLPFTQPVFVHQQKGCTLYEVSSAIASSQKLPAQLHVIGGKEEPHAAAWWSWDATLDISLCLPPQRSLMLPLGQAVGGRGEYVAVHARATRKHPNAWGGAFL